MKVNKTKLFIAVSSVALLMVLLVQVNWMVQTARIKEELFNEKANMVLSKTAAVLSADTATCKQMEQCIGENEIAKTDSLFTNYMHYYNFKVDYSFDVKKPSGNKAINTNAEANVYKQRLDEATTQNGLELNLFLPDKKQFILAEMGPMFFTSILLILVVMLLFWNTIRLLVKEKQLSEHTTDFLNNMTHEFKTPLTNIALAGKMMHKGNVVVGEEKVKHYSGIILTENEKLRLQVEQVLSMTALERGEIPLQKSLFDFHTMINDIVKSMSVQLENSKGSLILNLNADNFKVLGDKTHLANAVSNLLDNAVKYSLAEPQMNLRTFNLQQHLVLSVSDNGRGIEKQYHRKVFDKYFRVPTGNVHNVKGFGLGLAYVKKIVELHGGAVEVKKGSEKGCTFIVTLPYA